MSKCNDLETLQELINQWAQFGQVDLTAWNADDVLSVIATRPDIRDKFVAILEQRLSGQVQ
jgi:hypothetical protein